MSLCVTQAFSRSVCSLINGSPSSLRTGHKRLAYPGQHGCLDFNGVWEDQGEQYKKQASRLRQTVLYELEVLLNRPKRTIQRSLDQAFPLFVQELQGVARCRRGPAIGGKYDDRISCYRRNFFRTSRLSLRFIRGKRLAFFVCMIIFDISKIIIPLSTHLLGHTGRS